MTPQFLSIGDAANYLGVHINTLRRWEQQGYIMPVRTPGGHRRYLLTDLDKLKVEKSSV